MAKMGAPTKYKEEYVKMARSACERMGATIDDLADLFDVSTATIDNWQNAHDDFLEALKVGREIHDTNLVEASLRDRAIGYSHPEDKIFMNGADPVIVPTVKHYPPDPTSAIFWLKNRDAKRWKDKREEVRETNLKITTADDVKKDIASIFDDET